MVNVFTGCYCVRDFSLCSGSEPTTPPSMDLFLLRIPPGRWVSVQNPCSKHEKVQTKPAFAYKYILLLKGLTLSVRFTWPQWNCRHPVVRTGRSRVALLSNGPYGRSVELQLRDSPRHGWKCREPRCFAAFFSLCFSLPVFRGLFVPLFRCLFPSPYQSIWSPVLREILTDPLEELRDSISWQQNSTVVLGNSAALERWALKEE